MKVATSELAKHIELLERVKKEDIIITKSAKPIAVIIDYDKYQRFLENNKEKKLKAIESLEAFHLGGEDTKSIRSNIKI